MIRRVSPTTKPAQGKLKTSSTNSIGLNMKREPLEVHTGFLKKKRKKRRGSYWTITCWPQWPSTNKVFAATLASVPPLLGKSSLILLIQIISHLVFSDTVDVSFLNIYVARGIGKILRCIGKIFLTLAVLLCLVSLELAASKPCVDTACVQAFCISMHSWINARCPFQITWGVSWSNRSVKVFVPFFSFTCWEIGERNAWTK